MDNTITLRDANQGFARCVRDVEGGAEYTITRNGVPVARLIPVSRERRLTPSQQAALARTRARMAQGWPIGAGPLGRDALHER